MHLKELDDNALRTVAWAHGMVVSKFANAHVKPNGKVHLVAIPIDADEREEMVEFILECGLLPNTG